VGVGRGFDEDDVTLKIFLVRKNVKRWKRA